MSVYNTLVKESESEVERLGMDENWIDVTNLVKARIKQETFSVIKQQELDNIEGLQCQAPSCGCSERLYTGGVIAQELREKILKVHGLTVSAGVSYNKLLSKLGGGLNKPNNQTVIGPEAVEKVLKLDKKVTSIPGIGRRMGETLETAGILTVEQLRNAQVETLVNVGLAEENAKTIKSLAFGEDNTKVKMSGRVASIGLEDRFKGIYDKAGVKEKLEWLIDRLEHLIIEDGRQANTFKITVRDYFKDKLVKKFHKESRQTRVSPRLFVLEDGSLKKSAKSELVEIGVGLVAKMINLSQEFHLTLLGVAVTDFVDQVQSKNNIMRFFSPKKIENPQSKVNENPAVVSPIIKNTTKRNIDSFFNNNPSSSNKRKLNFDEQSKDNSKYVKIDATDANPSGEIENKALSSGVMEKCPEGYDENVWNSLPDFLKKEILETSSSQTLSSSICEPQTSYKPDDAFPCPEDADPEIFHQLPDDIKQEIIKNKKALTPPSVKKKSDITKYFNVKSGSKMK